MTEAKTIKFQNEVRMMKEKTSNRLGVHSFMLMTLVAIVTFAARGTSAQTTMVNADGLATTNFKTAQGTIQVNLPSEMTGPVSGSLRTFPTGQTAEEKARNLDALNTYIVRIQNKDTRVAAGSFRRIISGTDRTVDLNLLDKNGKDLSRAAVPIQLPPAFSCQDAMAPKVIMPKYAQGGRPLQIRGFGLFDGDSISTTIKVNGRETEVLAENSQEAVVECPTGVTGHANVEIKKYQTEFQNDVRILDVSLNAPKLDLRSGEQTTLTTTVRGLADLQEDLTLRLQNQTPNVVQLAGGEDQNVVIHPNDVQGTGVYTTTRTVTGKQPGGFNLTASVQNPSPITIPFQSTEQILTRSNEPTQNTRGPNAGTREEYFLPVGVAELDRQIAQQQWAGPSVPLQNPCCCCCCFWPSLPGGQRGGGPGPGPGPNPPQGPNPISTNVNLGANKFGPGKSIYVFAAPATPISGLKYHGEAYVQWNSSGGTGQLTVDVEVQRPGSTRWEKVVSSRGPNDEYLFTAGAPGDYLFRVTTKDSTGNSNFNTLSITFPHIPGIA